MSQIDTQENAKKTHKRLKPAKCITLSPKVTKWVHAVAAREQRSFSWIVNAFLEMNMHRDKAHKPDTLSGPPVDKQK